MDVLAKNEEKPCPSCGHIWYIIGPIYKKHFVAVCERCMTVITRPIGDLGVEMLPNIDPVRGYGGDDGNQGG